MALNDPTSEPVAIVTGGAGPGIGHGITKALVASGWSVVITDRQEERGRAFAEGLAKDGTRVEVVVLDVTEPGAAERTVTGA